MVEEAASTLAGEGRSSATESGDTGPSDADGATDILYREYQRVAEHFTRQFEYILRVAGIGFSAAAAVLYLVTSKDLQKHEWVYWVAPFGLSMLYSILIDLFYNMTYLSYYIRDLEDDIAGRAKVSYFHFHNSTVRGVASFRGGHAPRLANYLMILLFGIGIYVGMIVACMIGLQWEAHAPVWRQILFLSIQGSIGMILIWSAWGTTSSLRERYERWKMIGAKEARLHIAQSDQRLLIGPIISYAILPRRLDFLVKLPLTVGAALMTAWFMRIPLSAHLVAMLLYVVLCVEFLAKQATYIWNEILDLPADHAHPYKKTRRVLGQIGPGGRTLAEILFVVRAVTALVVAIALSHERRLVWLPYLVLAVFFLQFFYDRMAKRGAVRRLVVASTGYAERALAGILVVMSVAHRYDPVLLGLLSIWLVVLQFSTLAHLWWAEGWYLWDEKGREAKDDRWLEAERPYPPLWFLLHGTKAEWVANIILVVVGVRLAYIYSSGGKSQQNAATQWERGSAGKLLDPFHDAFWKSVHSVTQMRGSVAKSGVLGSQTQIVSLVLAAIVVLLVVRASLRGRGTPPPDAVPVPARYRNVFLIITLAAAAIAFLLLPVQLWLYVVAILLPLLVAIFFERLTFDELNGLDRLVNERVGQMVPWVHAKLFGPWALRITIVPLGSANDKSSVRWAEELRGAYSAWAKHHAGKSLKVTEIGDRGGDGGYPLDLIVHGDQWHWHELLRESGFHVRCGAGYDIAETLDPVPLAAWVNVTPISVATRRSVGAGLQYPDAPSIAFRPCLSCATSWPDGATDTASRKTASVSEAEALQSEEDGQSAATPKAQAEEPSAPVQPGASGHENEGGSDGGAARPARHPQIIRIYRFVREPQTDPAPPMQADPSTLQHIDTWVYGGGTKIMRAVPAIDSPLQSVLQKRQSADARRS